MKKRTMYTFELAIFVCLTVLLSYGTALEKQQQSISNRMIRLHIIANSDAQQDQEIKLKVRDAVLEQTQQMLEQTDSRDDAKKILREQLGTLEKTANETLQEYGSGQRADITLSRELFGTRNYDGFSLPGGYYDALRVKIGSGTGHNWWCVVYPQICTTAASEDWRTVAVMRGMDEEQVAILEGDTPEYQLKFRAIELLEGLLGWFRGGTQGIPVSG